MSKGKCVLAYSGGMDSTISVVWIKEKYDLDVITLTVDLGAGPEIEGVKEKSKNGGAIDSVVLDVKEEFVNEYVFPALKAGGMYEDVYALSVKINSIAGYDRIPKNCIEKLPSAELSEGQFDPFDYKIISPLVDRIIENHESPLSLIKEGFDAKQVYDIYNRIRINEYKRRQAAPGLRITSKAFGIGRRIPIVNHYKYQEE